MKVNLLNKKMYLAPVLAIALALSLLGATYYFPSGQASQSSPTSQTAPIPAPYPYGAASPVPSTLPAPASVTGESINLIPELSVAAALVVAIIAVLLLFSEKDLKGKNWN